MVSPTLQTNRYAMMSDPTGYHCHENPLEDLRRMAVCKKPKKMTNLYKTTLEILIDLSLQANFRNTLKIAEESRNNSDREFISSMILMRAAKHPGKGLFTTEYHGE